LKPYIGFISTSSNGKDLNDNLTDEIATATTLLVGGKGRVRVPIPYVAPYIEIGLGSFNR